MALHVTRSSPRHGCPLHLARGAVYIDFSAPLAAGSTGEGLALYRVMDARDREQLDPLPCRVTVLKGGTRVRIRPNGGFERGGVYLVRATPKLESTAGHALDQAQPPARPAPYLGCDPPAGAWQALFSVRAQRRLAVLLDPARPIALRDRPDLNLVDAEALAKTAGINRTRARALVAYRTKAGRFAEFSDGLAVPGVGEATVHALASTTSVDHPGSPTPAVHVARGRFVEVIDPSRPDPLSRVELAGEVTTGCFAVGADRAFYLSDQDGVTWLESVELGSARVLDRVRVPPASDMATAATLTHLALRGSRRRREVLHWIHWPSGEQATWELDLEPLTLDSADTTPRGRRPLRVTAEGDRVWLVGLRDGHGQVIAIDTRTGREVASIALPRQLTPLALAPATGSTRLWVLARGKQGPRAVEIDLEAGELGRRVALPPATAALEVIRDGATLLAAGGREVWRVNPSGGAATHLCSLRGKAREVRCDPATGWIHVYTAAGSVRRVESLAPGAAWSHVVLRDGDIACAIPVGINSAWAIQATNFMVVHNPGPRRANLTVHVRHEAGGYALLEPIHLSVAAAGRRVVAFHDVLIAHGGFSTRIHSDEPVVAERTSTSWRGARPSSVAVPFASAATQWWFAEGFHHRAFRNRLEIANPGAERVRVTITRLFDRDVPGLDRAPIVIELAREERRHVDTDAGLPDTELGFGLAVEASAPIVAERGMAWREGEHATTGAGELARRAHFASTITDRGATTFLLLAAPGVGSRVTVTLRDEQGSVVQPASGPIVVDVLTHGRATLKLDAAAIGERPLSITLDGSEPFVAERVVYLASRAGHALIGVSEGRAQWFFGEGWSGGDTRPILRIANVAGAAVEVHVRLLDREGRELALAGAGLAVVKLPPGGSMVRELRDVLPVEAGFSVAVTATGPVVVEREERWSNERAATAVQWMPEPARDLVSAGGVHQPLPEADRRFDLNRSYRSQLERLPEVGPVKARAITDHRRERGRFHDTLDLLDVPGFGGFTYEVARALVRVSPRDPRMAIQPTEESTSLDVTMPAPIPGGFLDVLEAGDPAAGALGAPGADLAAGFDEQVEPRSGALTLRQVDLAILGRGELDFQLARVYDTRALYAMEIVPRFRAELRRRLIDVVALLDAVLAYGRLQIAEARKEVDTEVARVLAEARQAIEAEYEQYVEEMIRTALEEARREIEAEAGDAEADLSSDLAEAEEDLQEMMADEPDLGDMLAEALDDPERVDAIERAFDEALQRWEDAVAASEEDIAEQEQSIDDMDDVYPERDDYVTEEAYEEAIEQWEDTVQTLQDGLEERLSALDDLLEDEPELDDFMTESEQELTDQVDDDYSEAYEEWSDAVEEAEETIDEMHEALDEIESGIDEALTAQEAALRSDADEQRDQAISDSMIEVTKMVEEEARDVREQIDAAEAELARNHARGRAVMQPHIDVPPAALLPLTSSLGPGWFFDIPRLWVDLDRLHVGGGAILDVVWDGDRFEPEGRRATLSKVAASVPAPSGGERAAAYELDAGRRWLLDADGLPIGCTDRGGRSWILLEWERPAAGEPRLLRVHGSAGDRIDLVWAGREVIEARTEGGRIVTYAYGVDADPARRVLSEVRDALGRAHTFAYDRSILLATDTWRAEVPLLSGLRRPGGGTSAYDYDSPLPRVFLPQVANADPSAPIIREEDVEFHGVPRVELRSWRDRGGGVAREEVWLHAGGDDELHVTRLREVDRLTRFEFRPRRQNRVIVGWALTRLAVYDSASPLEDAVPAREHVSEVDEHDRPEVVRVRMRGAPGLVTRFEYGGREARWGEPIRVVYEAPDGTVLRDVRRRFHAELPGRLVAIEGDVPAPRTWGYDEDGRDPGGIGRPTSTTVVHDGRSIRTLYFWDVHGNLVATTAPGGYRVWREYEARAGVPAAVLARTGAGDGTADRVWEMERDTATGWLIGTVRPDGTRTRWERDAAGRVTAILDPLGRRATVIYEDAAARHRIVAPDGRVTVVQGDGLGRATSWEERPRGTAAVARHRTLARDALGRVTQIKDPGGVVTSFRWDHEGRLLWRERLGQVWRYEHDDRVVDRVLSGETVRASVTTAIDPMGATTEIWRDAVDAVIAEVTRMDDGSAAVLRRRHDRAGRAVDERLPGGGAVRYRHDDIGRLVAVEGPEAGMVVRLAHDDMGRITALTDADGAETRWRYDRHGDVEAEIDALGNTWSWRRDALGREVDAATPDGAISRVERDLLGRVVAVIDPAGARSVLEWDEGDRLVASIDPTGAATRFTYDGWGELIAETNALGEVDRYERDALGEVIARVERNGARTAFERDALGRMTVLVDALGRRISFDRDGLGRVMTIRDTFGREARYQRDKLGRAVAWAGPGGERWARRYDLEDRVVRIEDGDGVAIGVEYDRAGRPVSATTARGATELRWSAGGRLLTKRWPSGRSQAYAYDAVGHTVGISDDLGPIYEASYDAMGRPRRETVGGATTEHSWDVRGLLVATTDPSGVVQRFEHDDLGRVVTSSKRSGDATRFTWDAIGRLAAIETPEGHRTRHEWNAGDRSTAVADPLGATTRYAYDVLGRLIERIDAAGHRRTWAFSEDGRSMTATDELGRPFRRGLDEAGRLIEAVAPGGATTRFRWSPSGRLLAVIDAANGQWLRSHGADGEIDATRTPLGARVTVERDTEGRVVRVTRADGSFVTYDWNTAGQLAALRTSQGDHVELGYDAVGRVERMATGSEAITRAYDAQGRPTRISRTGAPDIEIAYDDRGVPSRVSVGERVTRYTYDRSERLSAVAVDGVTLHIDRDAAGRVIARRTEGGFREARAYDAIGRTASIDAGAIRLDRTFDAVGNVLTEARDGAAPARYRYDAGDRLTEATSPSGSVVSWTFDAMGNRSSTSVGGEAVWRYRYDPDQRLSAIEDARTGEIHAVEHDAVGRMTSLVAADARRWSLRYDGFDRLVEARSGADVVRWKRDPAGMIEGRSAPDAEERFTHGCYGIVQSASGETYDWSALDELDRLALRMHGGEVGVVIQHPNGSVLGHVDDRGGLLDRRSEDPFGDPAAPAANAGPLGFAGRPRCASTGLVDMRARAYAPWLGRFLTPDPLHLQGPDPYRTDRYAFAGNNPLRFSDPLGLQHDYDVDPSFEFGISVWGNGDFDFQVGSSWDPADFHFDDHLVVTDIEMAFGSFDVQLGSEGFDFDDIQAAYDFAATFDVREVLDRLEQAAVASLGESLGAPLAAGVQAVAGAVSSFVGMITEALRQVYDIGGMAREWGSGGEYIHDMASNLGRASEALVPSTGYATPVALVGMGVLGMVTAPIQAVRSAAEGDAFGFGSAAFSSYLANRGTVGQVSRAGINAAIGGLGRLGATGARVQGTIRAGQTRWLNWRVDRILGAAGIKPVGRLTYGGVDPKGRLGAFSPSKGPRIFEQGFRGLRGYSTKEAGAIAQHPLSRGTSTAALIMARGRNALTTALHEKGGHAVQHATQRAWYSLSRAFYKDESKFGKPLEFTLSGTQPLPGAYNTAAALTPLDSLALQGLGTLAISSNFGLNATFDVGEFLFDGLDDGDEGAGAEEGDD